MDPVNVPDSIRICWSMQRDTAGLGDDVHDDNVPAVLMISTSQTEPRNKLDRSLTVTFKNCSRHTSRSISINGKSKQFWWTYMRLTSNGIRSVSRSVTRCRCARFCSTHIGNVSPQYKRYYIVNRCCGVFIYGVHQSRSNLSIYLYVTGKFHIYDVPNCSYAHLLLTTYSTT